MKREHTLHQILPRLPMPIRGVVFRTYLRMHGYSLRGYHQRRCIFVRIPKCATRSISNTLFGNKGGGHTDITTYRLVFDRRQFDEYFKFSFVRNPWDRLVSAYHFLRQGGVNQEDRAWGERNLKDYSDFTEFVDDWLNSDNIQTQIHFRPQCDFVCGNDGQLLVDFVGRYENLAEDFKIVRDRLGGDEDLLFLNRTDSRTRGYRDYYDDGHADKVAQVYARDISLFGYQF